MMTEDHLEMSRPVIIDLRQHCDHAACVQLRSKEMVCNFPLHHKASLVFVTQPL